VPQAQLPTQGTNHVEVPVAPPVEPQAEPSVQGTSQGFVPQLPPHDRVPPSWLQHALRAPLLQPAQSL
jgi:hypothetical protein